MRLLALLLIPSLAFAAPVPKSLKSHKQPALELILSADSSNVLEVTVRNNGRDPLELPFRGTPLDQLEIDLRGEKGEHYTIKIRGEKDAEGVPGSVMILAGKSETLSVHTCHSLPEVGGAGQTIIFTARLKHDGKVIESKPLNVKP